MGFTICAKIFCREHRKPVFTAKAWGIETGKIELRKANQI